MCKFLFVYGTLRQALGGRANELLARQSDFVGDGTIKGKLYNLGSYPGAVLSPDCSTMIRGEIYELRKPEVALNALDIYEGFTGLSPLFLRDQVSVFRETEPSLRAWVYVYVRAVDKDKLIPSGDYLEFLNQHQH